MRPSIFNKDPPSKSISNSKSSIPRSVLKKPKSTSAYLNGSNKPKILSWNLEDLISAYQDSGKLPPILSPTLPDNELFSSITVPSKKATPKCLSIDSEYDGEDEESIPISLLSPTLPPIFGSSTSATTKSNGSKLEQPIPKNPITIKQTPVSPVKQTSKSNNVRWINKINDVHKPRFLLRISINNKSKYKEIFTSHVELSGLGITTEARNTVGRESREEKIENSIQMKEETNKQNKEIERNIQRQKDKQPKEEKSQDKQHSKSFESELNEKQSQLLDRERQLQLKEKQLIEKERQLQERLERSNNLSDERKQIGQKKQNKDISEKEKQISSPQDRIKLESNQLLSSPLSSRSQKDEVKNSLMSKKIYWLKLAKQAKSKSEQSKEGLLSIIIQVDSLLLYMISYDYDERFKLIGNILPSERYWKILDEDISNLINKVDNFILNCKENNLIEFLKILNCILFQTKSIILKRINLILIKVIQSYINKKINNFENQNELNNKIIELQQSTINNQNSITENFINSKPNYLNSILPLKFPNTWFKKSLNIGISQKAFSNLKPANQNYYLPIGIYSNLNEISGFIFNFINEFIANYNKNNSNNTVKYSLKCGLN